MALAQFPKLSVIASGSWIVLIVLSATPWRYSPFWWAVLWIGVVPVMTYWALRYWWQRRQRHRDERKPFKMR
jgi:hypothetical protein